MEPYNIYGVKKKPILDDDRPPTTKIAHVHCTSLPPNGLNHHTFRAFPPLPAPSSRCPSPVAHAMLVACLLLNGQCPGPPVFASYLPIPSSIHLIRRYDGRSSLIFHPAKSQYTHTHTITRYTGYAQVKCDFDDSKWQVPSRS